MKTSTIVTAVIVIVVLIAGAFAIQRAQAPQASSIQGCYVAHLAQDVYTLEVQSEKAGVFTGTLEFDNFQKDSSSGTYTGTYKDDILLGTYSFASEGMNSVMQVAFKKTEEGFIRGFGPVKTEGDTVKFMDANQLSYEPPVFEAVSCR